MVAATDGLDHLMTELSHVVDAYEHTTRALLDLGRHCTAAEFTAATECPGWSVQDTLSHVVALEAWLLQRAEPEHKLPDGLDHVRGDFGRRIEVPVDRRRALTGAQVVNELEDVLSARLAVLRPLAEAKDQRAADEPVDSPLGGQMPRARLLAMRTFDIWTHEQDVRRAIGRPANLGSPAAEVAVAWLRRGLPRVVSRGAGLPVGSSVTVSVTGPVTFTQTVAVRAGDDGRPTGVFVDDPTGAVTITMGTEAFTRRSCGRWTVADTPAEVVGNADLAARVLQAMAVTP